MAAGIAEHKARAWEDTSLSGAGRAASEASAVSFKSSSGIPLTWRLALAAIASMVSLLLSPSIAPPDVRAVCQWPSTSSLPAALRCPRPGGRPLGVVQLETTVISPEATLCRMSSVL